MSNSKIHFSDGVRHLYVPGLNEVAIPHKEGIRSWLANSSNFVPKSSASDGYFEVTIYDYEEVMSVLAHDINRLSCAAVETINHISPLAQNEKSMAWNLIKYYYSAFYSAHSLLKILGFGLTSIDGTIIESLRKKCIANGLSNPIIKSGIYCVDVSRSEQVLRAYKVNRYDDSHRGMWKRYVDLLNVLEGVSVTTSSYDATCVRVRKKTEPYPMSLLSNLAPQDANGLLVRIKDVCDSLNIRGDSNWLSFVRNTVNYNHGLGVWFPYKDIDKNYSKITELKKLYQSSILDAAYDCGVGQDLVTFVKVCQMINSMNYDVIVDLSSRHPKNKSFLKNGVLSYEKHYIS